LNTTRVSSLQRDAVAREIELAHGADQRLLEHVRQRRAFHAQLRVSVRSNRLFGRMPPNSRIAFSTSGLQPVGQALDARDAGRLAASTSCRARACRAAQRRCSRRRVGWSMWPCSERREQPAALLAPLQEQAVAELERQAEQAHRRSSRSARSSLSTTSPRRPSAGTQASSS
jgi:hypothetical protein